MMNWQSNLNWQLAKQRAEYIQQIRNFFFERNIVEVETPLLSNGTITDIHLEAFKCQYLYLNDSGGNASTELYLQTSPEFAMKRLLASGYGSIFQLCKAFRHEEHGRFHNPEFSILEWYRVGFDQNQLMAEVDSLLQTILACNKATYISYQQAFIEHLNIDPLTISLAQLKFVMAKQGIIGDWIEAEQDVDILLQVLFSQCIEKKIGVNSPCFVYDYPKSQAALAKGSNSDPRVAERFECYYQGIELANGYHELTDAIELKQRFEADNRKRVEMKRSVKPIDENFMQAMLSGLPQCSGVALGLDRLLMLALKASDIKSTMAFDITKA